jgi:acyl-CoA synthetase (AMP-forming)/AMP-acid ligase II
VPNVYEALRRSVRWNADRPAVRTGDVSWTYAHAWDRGLRLANGLLSLGLNAGDRIAVLEHNCCESTDFIVAAAATNTVRVPLYKRNAPQGHAHMIRHSGCRAVIVDPDYVDEIESLRDALPEVEHVIVRDGGYEDWLRSLPNIDPDPAIGMDDPYIIRHSGGTTGLPKGMLLSHRAWMNTVRDWTYRLPSIEAGDHWIHAAAISHGSGYPFFPTWFAGGCNVLEPRFDIPAVLDMFERDGGFCFVVPTMVSDMLALHDGRARDFSKLKALVVSGAPILPQTAMAARAMFGDTLHQLYGQTEAVPVVWMTPKEWFGAEGSEPSRAVGRVMPFAELEIRDEDNRPLPAGAEGEIAVRNDGQMLRIWNEPEQTAARLVDGWVMTGDIGRLDADGYLHIVDRKDDMIISGGLNIWPAELEIVIAGNPAVREVAVVGAPHPRWGETPVAIVVLHEGMTADEAAIAEACAVELGSYKKPTRVILGYEPLPRTPVGKVQRKVLREPFWAGAGARVGGS